MGVDAERRGRKTVRSHEDLEVYQLAFAAAAEVFEVSKRFPREETYSLTDQIRRSSRSVCANLAEAWRKRRYEAAFTSKLNDSEGEAAETQVWIRFACKCEYLSKEHGDHLHAVYDRAIGMLVHMINNPEPWLLSRKPQSSDPRRGHGVSA
jgi:four helix bundle protein